MIRILLFATIALSLASASLAFLTRQKAEEKSGNLESTIQTVRETRSSASKLKEENKTAQARIEELSKSTEEQKAQADKVAANLKESEAKSTKLEAEMAEKGKKVESLTRQLEEALAAAKPDPAQEQKVDKLTKDLAETKQAAESEQKRLMQKAVELEGKVAHLTAKMAAESKAANGGARVTAKGGGDAGTKKAVSGTVVAVNEGWNFVVVDLGDKNGVTPETQLAVQRKGKVVANLKVTEVRPKHVSAGVEYAEGSHKEKVLLGDTVVVVPRLADTSAAEAMSPNDLFASPTAVP
jgi:hypothetical protein